MQPFDDLLPTPRSVTPRTGTCPVPDHWRVGGPAADLVVPDLPEEAGAPLWCHSRIDPTADLPPGAEAYRLTLGDDRVDLVARERSGLRAGLTTLVQLTGMTEDGVLPRADILDAPAFAIRGAMLDISRDRIPTMASLQQLLEVLARAKINHLQLYCEHAFAYPGHEAVWRAADPITPAEMQELDRRAAELGIALCGNQNTLGHMERWLRHPAYATLGETTIPWMLPDWGGHYLEPNTLAAGDPAALALVAELIAAQAACCSDSHFNIGCDEPLDLGRGRSAGRVAQDGRQAVFSDHLRQVAEACLAGGKRPLFWCDPEPNENDDLPTDLVALIWGYEADSDFAGRIAAHRACGRQTWVCPGTANWQTTTGRTWARRANLAAAARQGADGGSSGFLITEWGDRGHLQPWPCTLLGLVEGAQAAWTGGDRFDAAAAGRLALGDAGLGTWLADLGRADEDLSRGLDPVGGWYRRNTSALGHDLHRTGWEPAADAIDETPAWQAILERLDDLRARCSSGPLWEEAALGCDLARWTAHRALLRRRSAPPTPSERLALAGDLAPLIGTYREHWLRRSRYGGLEDSCRHLCRHTVWW